MISLEALTAQRGVRHRDCRTCRHLEPQGDGLNYGWCGAHEMFVKFYHPPGEFWSQCQFKAIARERTSMPRRQAAIDGAQDEEK
ncbi:MAG TPA: hypothetical protein VGF64_10380 [Acidimicrobiales bacterium]|jgi:hypothetical protein